MKKIGGADLRFLEKIPEHRRLYNKDLEKIGLASSLLTKRGWIRKNNLAFEEMKKNVRAFYANKKGVEQYCSKYFKPRSIEVVHIDGVWIT